MVAWHCTVLGVGITLVLILTTSALGCHVIIIVHPLIIMAIEREETIAHAMCQEFMLDYIFGRPHLLGNNLPSRSHKISLT